MILFLLACAWIDDAEHGDFIDADGDGFWSDAFTDGNDCDDRDAAVHPQAIEGCNGLDDDCDGATDEGTDAWYADADGDGFGDPSAPTCEPESGAVQDASDCDDGDPGVYPGAAELCDGIDNDCDGQADDEHPVWYPDEDGDGWGAGEAVVSCDAPDDHVGNAGDCDDTDAAVHPDATELCDSADNDCDGLIDEDDADDVTTWFADTDADGYGDASSTTEACDRPNGFAPDSTDCYDNNPDAYPGQSTWFDTSRGDGSYDYSCDSVEEQRWTEVMDEALCNEGWHPSFGPQDCGVTSVWVLEGCVDTPTRTQECR